MLGITLAKIGIRAVKKPPFKRLTKNFLNFFDFPENFGLAMSLINFL